MANMHPDFLDKSQTFGTPLVESQLFNSKESFIGSLAMDIARQNNPSDQLNT